MPGGGQINAKKKSALRINTEHSKTSTCNRKSNRVVYHANACNKQNPEVLAHTEALSIRIHCTKAERLHKTATDDWVGCHNDSRYASP